MKKKSLVGWIYSNDEFEFSNIDAWGGYIPALQICILKNKKSLGKFKGSKVRITIEELSPQTRRSR
jgi:hypothetical protein